MVLSREEGPVQVERGLAGRIVDPGIRDPANMGAAMAPAAADTLLRFFQATGTSPTEYDALFTGDLGAVGSQLLLELLGEQGLDLTSLHQDCGLLLYDRDRQDVHSGGSGCGCSAAVLCGRILPRLAAGGVPPGAVLRHRCPALPHHPAAGGLHPRDLPPGPAGQGLSKTAAPGGSSSGTAVRFPEKRAYAS